MVLKGLFGRDRQKPETAPLQGAAASAIPEPELQSPANAGDGWVELRGDRLVVHDPVGRGRYASLGPRGGVRLWVNGEETGESTVVQAADLVEFRLPEGESMPVSLTISPDGMTATAHMHYDPTRQADTVTIRGQNRAEVWPAASKQAPKANLPARERILQCLQQAGIAFGVDDAAVERLVTGLVGHEEIVARGQPATPPTMGAWEWVLVPNQMVEPGDLLAIHRPGDPNRPQITVQGVETLIYPPVAETEQVEAGDGARAMAGGSRIVAGRNGRFDRRELGPGHWQLSVTAARYLNGDQNGLNYEAEGDLVIAGNVRGANIRITGELVIDGSCQGSLLQARRIQVGGDLSESEALTMPKGHVSPLVPDFLWFADQLRWAVENSTTAGDKREEQLRVMLTRLQTVRKTADAINLVDAVGKRLLEALTKVLVGVGLSGIVSHGRALVEALDRLGIDAATEGDVGIGGSALRCRIWAGGLLRIDGAKVNACYLYAGGDLVSGQTTQWSQSEAYVAKNAHTGALTSIRGEFACFFRVGGHLTGQEILPGTIVEVGHQRQEFRAETFRVKVGLNIRGEMKMQRLG